MNFINGTAGKRNKCKEDDHTIHSLPLISGEQSPPPPLSLCMVSVRTPLLSTLSELTVTFNAKNIIL